uniref:PX domain-containing protein n=1 Tax=Ciona savignyi TaxID=51511 RepID=H2YLR9_CIOSA
YNNQNKQPNTLLTHQFPFLQPSKDRFFRHIRIQEANAVEELFEGGRRYTLYKITYFAPPNKPQQHRETHNFTSGRLDGRLDGRLGGTEADLHEFQVRRRFREFLVLQDRLNEKRNIKKMMLKIRGPSRMFPMPIGNLDEGYIEKRRKLLQAFLRELCSQPEISETTELRQFLAYNTDPRIAYVRKSSDYIPRFDKMFKNAVQELIGAAGNKFSDKFPSDIDDELMN